MSLKNNFKENKEDDLQEIISENQEDLDNSIEKNTIDKDEINKDEIDEDISNEDNKEKDLVNELLKENQILGEENKKLKEDLIRSVADFSNYKKRLERESEITNFEISKKIILNFLNFKENLKLAIKNETNNDSLENLNQLNNNFNNILSRLNIQKIQVLDQPFDYHTSECVTRIKSEDKEKNNLVVDVLEDGYTYKNKLLKPAKVIVGYLEE